MSISMYTNMLSEREKKAALGWRGRLQVVPWNLPTPLGSSVQGPHVE